MRRHTRLLRLTVADPEFANALLRKHEREHEDAKLQCSLENSMCYVFWLSEKFLFFFFSLGKFFIYSSSESLPNLLFSVFML